MLTEERRLIQKGHQWTDSLLSRFDETTQEDELHTGPEEEVA